MENRGFIVKLLQRSPSKREARYDRDMLGNTRQWIVGEIPKAGRCVRAKHDRAVDEDAAQRRKNAGKSRRWAVRYNCSSHVKNRAAIQVSQVRWFDRDGSGICATEVCRPGRASRLDVQRRVVQPCE